MQTILLALQFLPNRLVVQIKQSIQYEACVCVWNYITFNLDISQAGITLSLCQVQSKANVVSQTTQSQDAHCEVTNSVEEHYNITYFWLLSSSQC